MFSGITIHLCLETSCKAADYICKRLYTSACQSINTRPAAAHAGVVDSNPIASADIPAFQLRMTLLAKF